MTNAIEPAPRDDLPPVDDLLPMREVVNLTGVNPVTLRAWERRYGLIRPVRTEGGHRLYSRQDIDNIRAILLWTSRGVSVGKVGELLAQQQSEAMIADAAKEADHPAHWRALFRQALAAYDRPALERLYGEMLALYAPAMAFEQVLLPLWRTLMFQSEFGARSQWLLLDTFLRAQALLHLSSNRGDGACAIVADMSGNGPELELLNLGLLVSAAQLRVEVLTPQQPLEEIPLICEALQPDALVLLALSPAGAEGMKRLQRLQMGVTCPVALAGEGAEATVTGLPGAALACLGDRAATILPRLRALLRGALEL